MEPWKTWFKNERGINPETLDKFGVYYDEADRSVVFPYNEEYRKRRYLNGERRFSNPPGESLEIYNKKVFDSKPRRVFICEGETDTLCLSQFTESSDGVAVVGLPGINSWRSNWAPLFDDVEEVYVVLDNDKDYSVKSKVDDSWSKIRRDLGRRARRVYLPSSNKDVCEFFKAGYTLDDFELLCSTARDSTFNTINLAKPPPPVDWLVDGIIAEGDIVLLMGEPGVGKSWMAMDLSIAVTQQDRDWLGHEVLHKEQSKILYIDEENPLDVVYSRFQKLGIQSDNIENICYLHGNGISLEIHGKSLLEEVAILKPKVTVLDSLTRLHNGDENSSGDMARMFNEFIRPISRQLGSSVVVLHHAGKSDGSSYRRSRGSGDIVASVDVALDISPIDANTFKCNVFKSRRRKFDKPFFIKIQDNPDGTTTLRYLETVDPF